MRGRKPIATRLPSVDGAAVQWVVIEDRMRLQPVSAWKQRMVDTAPNNMDLHESGIILIDWSMNPIASDAGAIHILNGHRTNTSDGTFVPEEILAEIRRRPPSDNSCRTMPLWIGKRRYRCRFYVVESNNPAFSQGMLAVHFEGDSDSRDPIRRIAVEHHLTEREEEVLRRIALGLSTKELAHRMSISPNTVKAFVRLIMIKLGVATRTAIIGKLLDTVETK